MPVTLYMDHHVPRAIVAGLRLRGVDVVTADEDGYAERADPDLLDRATELGRVLFSQDRDLLAEATQRQSTGVSFNGLMYGHQLRVSIGDCVRDLEVLALVGEDGELTNLVVHRPI